MNATEAKQKVIDALLAKLRDALDLELVEGLLEPVYNFNPNGWMLFRLVGRLLGSCCFSCITADGWRALCRIEQPRARRTLLRYRLLSAMPR